jgi:hypothetical protein
MRALSPAKPDLWSMLLGSPEAPAALKHHTITISAGHRAKHGSAGPFGARLGGAALPDMEKLEEAGLLSKDALSPESRYAFGDMLSVAGDDRHHEVRQTVEARLHQRHADDDEYEQERNQSNHTEPGGETLHQSRAVYRRDTHPTAPLELS